MWISIVRGWMAAMCFCISADPALCADLAQGNLLAAYGDRIYEVTTGGSVVQSFQVPGLAPFSGRKLGDLMYDRAGKIHVRINSSGSASCCSALISTLDIATESWIHTAVSNYNPGGYDLEIAKLGRTLFTERNQFNLITRESINVRPTMHFTHPDERAENLTLGRDGYFYATSNFNPARAIYRIDPVTYEQVGAGFSTANPAKAFVDVHGIAVKENGDYFVVDFEGAIYSFTSAQRFTDSSATIGRGPGDLSLSKEGILAFGQSRVGQNAGTLAIFDEQLQLLGQVTFQSSSDTDGVYTSFIEVPEPGCAIYLIVTLTGMVIAQRSRR